MVIDGAPPQATLAFGSADARDLARVVSLAARIEPELLRAARLDLLPRVGVAAEADLWFSEAVQSRTPLAIVLRGDLLDDLRADLAGDPELLDRSWEVLRQVHAAAPAILRLEEELTWLGVRAGVEDPDRLVDGLQSALVSMVEQDRSGIARWTARALERLPAAVRDLHAAKMLDVGARLRLGSPVDVDSLPADAADWLPWVMPRDMGSVEIGVRLLEGAVEINSPDTSGAHVVAVPGTNPPFIEVSWTSSGTPWTRHVPIAQPIEKVVIPTGTMAVRLRTATGLAYDLVRRVRPATDRVFGLRGRVVTMDESRSVIPDGIVYVDANTIFAVQPAGEPAPQGFEDVETVDTGGTIFPGLIELHRHLGYDSLPLWEVPRRYSNREQWARDPSYRAAVSNPGRTLERRAALAVMRRGEARCLAAGVTTSQGVPGAMRFASRVMRIVESSRDPELPPARVRTTSIKPTDVRDLQAQIAAAKSCFLLHLAEGTDERARAEFDALRTPDGGWAIGRSLAIVHATALGSRELETLKEHGGAVVWSPLHDLLLYGATLDIRLVRGLGLRLAIGSSWPVTGSRNLLAELKWARAASRVGNGSMSDADIVAAVTADAADIAGWGRLLGAIVPGKRADLLVIDTSDGDPYTSLVDATEDRVRLVMVDGVSRYGLADLMQPFGGGTEERALLDQARRFDFTPPVLQDGTGGRELPSLADAERQLEQVLSALPDSSGEPEDVAESDFPGVEEGEIAQDVNAPPFPETSNAPSFAGEPVRGRPLEALTVVEDPDYLPRLLDQANIPPAFGELLGARSYRQQS